MRMSETDQTWPYPAIEVEGQYDPKIDEKGRVSVPAEFRSILSLDEGSELVLTRHLEVRCLLLFWLEAWETFKRRIASISPEKAARVRRVVQGSARRVKLDKIGRIQLPTLLRNFAGLELQSPCLLNGVGNCMEIWSEDHWNESYGGLVEDSGMDQLLSI